MLKESWKIKAQGPLIFKEILENQWPGAHDFPVLPCLRFGAVFGSVPVRSCLRFGPVGGSALVAVLSRSGPVRSGPVGFGSVRVVRLDPVRFGSVELKQNKVWAKSGGFGSG